MRVTQGYKLTCGQVLSTKDQNQDLTLHQDRVEYIEVYCTFYDILIFLFTSAEEVVLWRFVCVLSTIADVLWARRLTTEENGFPDETIHFPCADHCPPQFSKILEFCRDVEAQSGLLVS